MEAAALRAVAERTLGAEAAFTLRTVAESGTVTERARRTRFAVATVTAFAVALVAAAGALPKGLPPRGPPVDGRGVRWGSRPAMTSGDRLADVVLDAANLVAPECVASV